MFQFIIHVLTETSVILSYTSEKRWKLNVENANVINNNNRMKQSVEV